MDGHFHVGVDVALYHGPIRLYLSKWRGETNHTNGILQYPYIPLWSTSELVPDIQSTLWVSPRNGRTAIQIAQYRDHPDVVDVLQKREEGSEPSKSQWAIRTDPFKSLLRLLEIRTLAWGPLFPAAQRLDTSCGDYFVGIYNCPSRSEVTIQVAWQSYYGSPCST